MGNIFVKGVFWEPNEEINKILEGSNRWDYKFVI